MPEIIYLEHNGTEHRVKVETGSSAMQGAVNNGIPGIDGDCGGQAACATCHVFVDAAWIGKVGTPRSDQESEMLDLAVDRADNSRLACQIEITSELEGLVLRMPEQQF